MRATQLGSAQSLVLVRGDAAFAEVSLFSTSFATPREFLRDDTKCHLGGPHSRAMTLWFSFPAGPSLPSASSPRHTPDKTLTSRPG